MGARLVGDREYNVAEFHLEIGASAELLDCLERTRTDRALHTLWFLTEDYPIMSRGMVERDYLSAAPLLPPCAEGLGHDVSFR